MTVALHGDQGKPRPALVVRSDQFSELRSVAVLPITGHVTEAALLRVTVEPTATNGLLIRSQIMIDKLQVPAQTRVGPVIGHLDRATLVTVNQLLTVFLGLA